MKRGDNFFAAVGNKFCCSEHFLLMDNKQSLTDLRKQILYENIVSKPLFKLVLAGFS